MKIVSLILSKTSNPALNHRVVPIFIPISTPFLYPSIPWLWLSAGYIFVPSANSTGTRWKIILRPIRSGISSSSFWCLLLHCGCIMICRSEKSIRKLNHTKNNKPCHKFASYPFRKNKNQTVVPSIRSFLLKLIEIIQMRTQQKTRLSWRQSFYTQLWSC